MIALNKKILLLGDRGQLGAQFLKSVSDDGSITTASDFSLDISNQSKLLEVLNIVSPHVVINCAAFTAVDIAEEEPEKAFAVNSIPLKTLAQWCDTAESHLIHVSTDYVFSGDKPLFEAYVETDTVGPLSVYGKSKLLGEEAIRKVGSERFSILRTAWLYGIERKNFLKTVLRLAMSDPEKMIKIVNDQYGSPTSVDSLVRQIHMVLDQKVYGTLHAASHGYCSWYDLAKEFLLLMGVSNNFIPCTTEEYPTIAPRPKNSILANQILMDLNVDCFLDWRDDLALFVDSYKDELMKEHAVCS